jgi:hypothetical protein
VRVNDNEETYVPIGAKALDVLCDDIIYYTVFYDWQVNYSNLK